MRSTVKACPECDGTDIWLRSHRSGGEPKYGCATCGHSFDDPVERESRSTNPSPNNANYAHLDWSDLELTGN